jgi:homoserine dehydrogenase
VLPIGGLKEKVLAAHRAGIKRVIVPERNKAGPRRGAGRGENDLEFVFVSKMDQVLEAALEEMPKPLARPEQGRVSPELDRARLTTDPEAVLGDPSIDVVIEVMGGVAPARGYVERALDAKRSVVTANKMLLALHGPALVDRAIANGVDLAFEGSVGGGIPVIRVLREALASDWVVRSRGSSTARATTS